jgi:hypothetical protein
VGSFYAQSKWIVTTPDHVSVPALQRLLQDEVSEGWRELLAQFGMCLASYADYLKVTANHRA